MVPTGAGGLKDGEEAALGAAGTTSLIGRAAETWEKDLGSPEPVPSPTLLCRSRIREHY